MPKSIPGTFTKSKERPMKPIMIQFFGNKKLFAIPSLSGRKIQRYKKEAINIDAI